MAKTNSDYGDFAQLLFHARLKQNGFEPLFVTSGSLPFDVGAWNRETEKFYRVQIKSTQCRHSKNLWRVCARRTDGTRYTRRDMDILAVYLVWDDAFFLMPVDEVLDRTHLLVPTKDSMDKPHRFDKYRENWGIFKA